MYTCWPDIPATSKLKRAEPRGAISEIYVCLLCPNLHRVSKTIVRINGNYVAIVKPVAGGRGPGFRPSSNKLQTKALVKGKVR